MPYKLKCENCGKEFINERPRKFCSFDCFLKYKRKQTLKRKKEFLEWLEKIMEAKEG